MIKRIIQLISAIVVCQSAGVIGSIFTASAIPTWYSTLTKPVFSPPNFIFGPVWITLYTLMGISLFLVWQQKLDPRKNSAIILFFIHLIFNAMWSVLFFGLQNITLALFEIVVLWLLIIIVIQQFWKINRLSAFLLLPYLVWVSFAALLNAALLYLNVL